MGLFISPEMYRQVRGHIIVECPIEKFVYCNTRNDDIVNALNELSFPLDQYNEYFITGVAFTNKRKRILMPYMEIKNGVAVDHDGRHRATALRHAGKTHVPVALINIGSMKNIPEIIKGRFRGSIRKKDLLPHVSRHPL